jgi:hypothetical protein
MFLDPVFFGAKKDLTFSIAHAILLRRMGMNFQASAMIGLLLKLDVMPRSGGVFTEVKTIVMAKWQNIWEFYNDL